MEVPLPEQRNPNLEGLLIEAIGIFKQDSNDPRAKIDLAARLNEVDDKQLMSLAEWHGVGTLLYHLLRSEKANLHPGLWLILQGTYLRQRDISSATT